ncbi:MAG: hypothetical protein HY240_05205 [Actinobacteria bacterium]|nr:hypothetical protein [Actinomycetota bacterium]
MERKRHPFAAVGAAVFSILMIAGAAVAYPHQFEMATLKIQSSLLRDRTGSDATGAGTQDQQGSHQPHAPQDCSAIVDGAGDLSAAPHGLQTAIVQVEANCEKNLQANGLLIALQHLVVNAQRRIDGHAGANGRAGDHGPATSHGNAYGRASG